MNQMLRDGLRELAEDAPVVTPRPEAWSVGRRSHQRRVAGGVAAGAAGVLLIVAAGAGLVAPSLRLGSDTADQPTYNPSQLALPTDLSRPSPWESGTAEAGPLGPLAAIGEVANRQTSWFHRTYAYYGISAADGAYRYLDLPNMALNGTPALSPDGSHIAYWTQPRSSDDPTLVGGFAVYDASTGVVTSRSVQVSDRVTPQALAWSPENAQVMAYYSARPAPDLARTAAAEIFDVSSGDTRSLDLPPVASSDHRNVTWGPAGVSFWRPPTLTTIDPATGAVTRDVVPLVPRSIARTASDVMWSPDGSELAMTAQFADPGGPYLQVNSLGVYGLPPGGYAGPPRPVQRVSPFDGVHQFLGWSDDTHALVVGVPTEKEEARADAVAGVWSIDVVSGSFTKVASVSIDQYAWLRGIATGLAAHAFVDRPGPAGHADPRAVWARVAAGLFIAALIVVVVVQRRREQPTARRSDVGAA